MTTGDSRYSDAEKNGLNTMGSFCAKSGFAVFNFKHYDEVQKHWGEERILVNSDKYAAKLMVVYPGWQTSLHRHKVKHETFVCITGVGFIDLEHNDQESSLRLSPGTRVEIPEDTWHRFGSDNGMMLLEVSTHDDSSDCERKLESCKLVIDDL